MPGKKEDIKPSFDQLDNQIVDMVGNYVKRRRAHYEAAAKKLHASLKTDAIRYTEMAADGLISADELDHLIKGRWAQLKIEMLSEASLARNKAEGLAADVLKLSIGTALRFV